MIGFMERSLLATVSIAIIIGISAIGYTWYTNNLLNNQIELVSTNLTTESEELQNMMNSESVELHSLINGLQGTITSMQTSITQNQQANSASAQQITEIQSSFQSLETELSSVSSQLSTTEAINSMSLQQISSQLQNINATIQTLSAKVNAITPQVPQSTLIIVANSYNASANTFTFIVQNTQDTLVYAQISATLHSNNCGLLGNGVGTYISQIYSFKPSQNTTTTLDLNLGSFQGYLSAGSYRSCSQSTISFVKVSYIVAPDKAVSPIYTFNVIPAFIIP